jgi:D-alanyl-D-alanine carboxypeptidase
MKPFPPATPPSRREFLITSAGAAGALVLAACGSSSTNGSSSASTAAAGGVTTPAGSTPGSAAAVPAYASTWTASITKQLQDMLVPGSAVRVETPDGVYEHAFGVRTFGGSEPVTLDDRARIGSVTKTMTGTLLLQLVQDGKISVDDPVSKYRTDVPNGQNITINQVLLMRSGLANYTTTLAFNQTLDSDPGKQFAPEELLAMGLALPPSFPPGTGYQYSNTNTVLLGLIVEKLTGSPFITVLQDKLLTPAGLKQTSFPAAGDLQIPPPSPHGYQFGTNVATIDSPVLPPDQQAAAKAGTLQPIDMTNANPSWTWAAGEAISTVADLSVYVQKLVGGGLLDAKTQAARMASFQPVKPEDPNLAYGWQLAQFGPMYGHTGELPGFNTFVTHDPNKKNTIAVWTNLNSSVDGQACAIAVGRWILEQLYSPSASEPPAASDAAPGD